MKKKQYFKPEMLVIPFAEKLLQKQGSTETEDIMAKEMDFDDNGWFSDEVKDYTEIWQSESEKWQ